MEICMEKIDYRWLTGYENMVLSIAGYHGYSPFMAFSKEWGFCFDYADEYKKGDRLGDYLDFGLDTFTGDLLKFHGIKMNQIDGLKEEELWGYITRNIIEEKPILVGFERGVFDIIVGYGDGGDIHLLCGEAMNIYKFKDLLQGIYDIEIHPVDFGREECIKALNYTINKMNFLNSLKKLGEFKEAINEGLDTKCEFRDISSENIERTHFMRTLKALRDRQMKMSMVLRFMKGHIQKMEIYKICGKLHELYELWDEFRENMKVYHMEQSVAVKERMIDVLRVIGINQEKVIEGIGENLIILKGLDGSKKNFKCSYLNLEENKRGYTGEDIIDTHDESGTLIFRDYSYADKLVENKEGGIRVDLNGVTYKGISVVATCENKPHDIVFSIKNSIGDESVIRESLGESEGLAASGENLHNRDRNKFVINKSLEEYEPMSIEIHTEARINAVTFVNDGN